ncbi:MAG: hypothetical protein K8I00_07080, partial [Candidatus Omnitrophica bacterium]|nr:hypothetical protein [Candidatus Omnitrophota bacterium]
LSSVVAGLLFFGSCWLTSWSVISRIDTFGLMLSLAGLAVITGDAARRRSAAVMAAAGLFSLALFTRQSLIAAPLACILTGIFSTKKEGGPTGWHKATFLGTMLLFPLSVFAGLMLMSHGEFYRHTVIYTMGEFDFGNFFRWMREFLEMHGVIVFLSLAYVGYCWRRKRYRLAVNFWGLALAVSLTAGKEGSSINYFLEFWAANCLMIGLMLSDLARAPLAGWKKMVGPVVVGVLLIQIMVLHYRTDFNPVRDKYHDASQRLSDYIRLAPGDVLSEYTGYLIRNNKTPIYQPFSMTQLAERGLWDEDVIIQDIHRQRFSLIVMTNVGMAYNRWSARVQAAVQEKYDMVDTLPCYELSYYHSAVNVHVVYKPKETRLP